MSVFHQTRYNTFYGFVQKQISEWLQFFSSWISRDHGEIFVWEFNSNQSVLFQAILRSVSERIRKIFCISFDTIWSKSNLLFINPNKSEPSFQSDESQVGMVGLKIRFGSIQARIRNFVRIHLEWCMRLKRNKSDLFLIVFIKLNTKRFTDWSGNRFQHVSGYLIRSNLFFCRPAI